MVSHYKNIRVNDWPAFLGIAILGFTLGLSPSFIINPNYMIIAKFIISCVLFLAFTFSINNCFDVKEDKACGCKNPVAQGLISFKKALLFSLVIFFLALITAFFWFEPVPFALYAFLLFLGGSYSIPFLRFKAVPVIDVVSHGLFFGSILFIFGLIIVGHLTAYTLLFAVSIFICSAIFELENHCRDFKTDSASNVKTTACWLGLVKTKKILRQLSAIHYSFLILLLILMCFRISSVLPLFISGGVISISYITGKVRKSFYPNLIYGAIASSYLIYLIYGVVVT